VATLTAWKFDGADKAEQAIEVLKGLEKQELVQVLDAAWVSWPADKRRPKTHQMHSAVGIGALGGGFWGLLFGLIFFVPVLGVAIGAAAGAFAGSLADVGIDDDFIKQVRDKVTPGTSAMFALTDAAVEDRVVEAFKGFDAELVSSNLSHEQESRLREAFSDD
jgi:uncharacterized membrane protein